MALRRTSQLAAAMRGRPPARSARPQTRSLESAYLARIRAVLTEYREIVTGETDKILDYLVVPQAPKFDDAHDIIERTFSRLRARIFTLFDRSTLTRLTTESALQIANRNRDQFRRMAKTVLKVDPINSEPWLVDAINRFVKENISLISSIPEKSLGEVERMLYRDSQRRLSPQEMRRNLKEQFDITEARADLIATDQVLKFNGSLTELRQRGIGVKRYIWRTSEDQRVRGNPSGLYPNARPSHYALNGKVFEWDKPPLSGTKGEHLHPGLAIRCRCYAEPILREDELVPVPGE